MAIFSLISKKKRVTPTIPYKKSYSQSGEDLLVEFIFYHILNIKDFTYMDIGAHHPYYLSNTAIFYEKGNKGISIEPDPILFNEIKKERPNEICLNIGIMFNKKQNNEELAEFYIMSTTTLNTFSKKEAERLHYEGTYKITEKKMIPVKHIHQIIEEYFLPDFVSIDVEGIDYEIIQSFNLKKYRPKVICIETLEFSPNASENIKNKEIINYLSSNNYFLYADTNINSIFIDNNLLNFKRK
jgi:FkbM family methyltransferase